MSITGASSGIGEAIALKLAHHGAKIILGARRKENLEKVTDKIRTAGGHSQLSDKHPTGFLLRT